MEVFSSSAKDILKTSVSYPYSIAVGLLVGGSVLIALKRYFGGGVRCLSQASLQDKTAIVTGANTGIGLETALDLARRGARVILACRSKEKGEAAVEHVKKLSKNQNISFAQVDLASLESVRNFAAKTLEEEARVDILINNARVMIPPYTKTSDGFELQFGVNHLAHFLITDLLLERLKQAPAARIVNVSALAHKWGRINFDDLQSEKSYNKFWAYAQSKLANVFFTRSLARRLRGTPM